MEPHGPLARKEASCYMIALSVFLPICQSLSVYIRRNEEMVVIPSLVGWLLGSEDGHIPLWIIPHRAPLTLSLLTRSPLKILPSS